MTENENPTPAGSDDVEGHRFLALAHGEQPPADSDDDVAGHRFVASGIRATDDATDDDSDDDVSGHRFVASGIRATDDADPGSEGTGAPGLTGALKDKNEV